MDRADPGTLNVSRLRENIAAADVVLTAEDLAEIDAAADRRGVQQISRDRPGGIRMLSRP